MAVNSQNLVQNRSGPSLGWMAYFLLSIAVVGALTAYALGVPFMVLGRLFPGCKKIGDGILVSGIAFLMRIQPWLKDAHFELAWPDGVSRERGCLIVSNHRSTLDAFLLLARVRGIRILAKRPLFWVPFLGLMMWLTRQIAADSSALVILHRLERNLRQGEIVHVFPEMTRCTPGFRGVKGFSTLPFQAALRERVPVLPVVFRNTDRAWPKGSWRLSPGAAVSAEFLSALNPADFSSAQELCARAQQLIETSLL